MNELQIFTDGGSRGNPGPAGIGIWVVDEQQQSVYSQATFIGHSTNNQAEYEAFLASLEWLVGYVSAQPTAVKKVSWWLDSKLVVEQLNRRWKIKHNQLVILANKAWKLLDQLPCEYQITHIPREQNQQADALANQAMDEVAEA